MHARIVAIFVILCFASSGCSAGGAGGAGGSGGVGVSPSGVPAAVTEFWVSPEGNDAAPGTRNAPFRTLERARDAIRGLEAPHRNGTLTVYVREGTYRLERALALDARDSGSDGHEVVYRAAPGEHPVISGAIRAQSWTLHDPSLHIHRAWVGPRKARQFYVNGQRATRARTQDYPAGFLPAFYNLLDTPAPGALSAVPVGIEFIPTDVNPPQWRDPATWTNAADIEAVIETQWKMMRVPLASITPYPDYTPSAVQVLLQLWSGLTVNQPTGLITLQEPAWTNANVFVTPPLYQPGIWSFWQVTRFENAYAFLDEPGEWYLDGTSGWIYYIPREGEDMDTADAELPVLEALVDARANLERPLTNLRFEGLTFAYATWLAPSGPDGYVADQSGFHLVGATHKPNVIGHDPVDVRTDGALRFRFTRHVTLRGNIFEHLGGAGVDFDTGSQANRLIDNLFDDISSAAIQLGGISTADSHPDRPEQVTQDNEISNNLIRHVGREYTDAAGIFIGFTLRTLVSHNTIIDSAWSGIAIGWGWGLLDPGGYPGVPGAERGSWGHWDTPTPNRNARILNNRIARFINATWDGGAIYTTGHQGTSWEDGLLIEGNVASDKRPDGGGNTFYTDGGSRWITLRNNASFNNPVGHVYLGPPPRTDSSGRVVIPTWFPLLWPANTTSYGSDIGGCRTYGDIRFVGNYWLHPDFYDVCPFEENGVSYPTDMIYDGNHVIRGEEDVPRQLLREAGVQYRPDAIPAGRWVTSPEAP